MSDQDHRCDCGAPADSALLSPEDDHGARHLLRYWCEPCALAAYGPPIEGEIVEDAA